MSNAEGDPSTPILLSKARNDALLLRKIANDSEVADEIVGFHAQQTVEKALKAALDRSARLLTARGLRIRSRHGAAPSPALPVGRGSLLARLLGEAITGAARRGSAASSRVITAATGATASTAAIIEGSDRRRRRTRAGVLAIAAALAFAAGGCGDGSPVSGAAKRAAYAACRQAASGISDPVARQAADQACRTEASVKGASQAAKRAARRRCLEQARRVVDPVARRQVRALCPKAS